ncbi:winged helix DNA-binding domain-containing protein [Millisia brevis]|uniref:winged helix DNA-binding domain-containing protein n=1 Tax=Millisia brevis TaxID=264148 RepID=UPI000ACB3546|nr:winged helix DNA-binding domain-containing protein [Millisia brevis]
MTRPSRVAAVPGNPIVRERMARQQVTAPSFDDPVEVVRSLGAMQAQDYGQSLWAIASRLRVPAIEPVRDAIASGRILRTWPMRGTIHWVPAEDAGWMVGVSAERTLRSARTRHEELGVDAAAVAAADELLTARLVGGHALARPDVMALWEDAGIRTDQQRGYHLLWTLAHHGRIAIGPMAGKQQTFVLLDEFAPEPMLFEPVAGLAELAARYLNGHGPATVHDVAWWTGTTVSASRAAVDAAAAAGRVIPFAHDDRQLWTGASTPTDVDEPVGVRLLASFDEFCLGYKTRDDCLDPRDFTKVVPGANGIFHPTFLVDGVVVGTWRRTVNAKSIDVTVDIFRPRSATLRDLRAAIDRFVDAYDLPVGAVTIDR